MAYYDNVNQTLVDSVELTAHRICEFGRGAGALARAIRQRIPDVHYVGVELMPDQLDRARAVHDVAINRNLDQLVAWWHDSELDAALQLNCFNHVIFDDVLEHLYNPQNTICQAVLRLAPGGSALVCIPNV